MAKAEGGIWADYFFGVLHSRFHEVSARAQGTQVRERDSGVRYSPATCFETFPLPEPTQEQNADVTAAAKELTELRENWLDPPERTTTRVLEFSGSIDGPWSHFVVNAEARGIGTVRYPRDEECAKKLAKRTLTNLYNEHPPWLVHAHAKLDAAVAAACGFNVDLTDEQIFDVSEASWPKIPAQFDMQGMRYKYIRAVKANELESHKALVQSADQSAYSADVYGNLEEFFKRQGYRADADRAFIAGKWREQKEYFHRGNWFRWLGSWTLYLLVGYGRRPWQAAIPCAVLVALGCVLFSPAKMELQDPKELQKPEETRHQYNRFWYSLGLFLPVVDLKSSELWKPMKKHPFLRNYVRVHILMGWILIPLVLAALTGLIK